MEVSVVCWQLIHLARLGTRLLVDAMKAGGEGGSLGRQHNRGLSLSEGEVVA